MAKKSSKKEFVPLTSEEYIKLHFSLEHKIQVGSLWGYIKESFENGKIYKCYCECTDISYGNPKTYWKEDYWAWYDLFPFRTEEENKSIKRFSVDEFNKFQSMQTSLDGLIGSYYFHFGIDLNPDYQRDLVWDLEDKQKLIHSIFNNIEIGKFALLRREYKENPGTIYEVVDGKQRITALVEFITNKFIYSGLKYSELSWKDQIHIDNYPIYRNLSWAIKKSN